MAGNGGMTQGMMDQILDDKFDQIHEKYWSRGIRGNELKKMCLQELEDYAQKKFSRYLDMVNRSLNMMSVLYGTGSGYIAPHYRRGGRRTRTRKSKDSKRSRKNKRLR